MSTTNSDGKPRLNTCKKSMSYKLFLLFQLQHINIDTRKIFYNAHIKPHIDYASVMWGGCGEVYFKKTELPTSKGRQINPSRSFPIYRAKDECTCNTSIPPPPYPTFSPSLISLMVSVLSTMLSYSRKHLPSAVPWIFDDRLLCLVRYPRGHARCCCCCVCVCVCVSQPVIKRRGAEGLVLHVDTFHTIGSAHEFCLFVYFVFVE